MIKILFPIIFTIILTIGIIIINYNSKKRYIQLLKLIPIYLIVSLLINLVIITVIENVAADDIEIWSGRIIEVSHKEEWDEWHPPKTYYETEYYYVNGKKKSKEVKKTKPGYWEHHNATNDIKTSDDGWHYVKSSADGSIKFNDKYPNTNEELELYYKIGQPTSSLHHYQNKLKFSKSLFKVEEIDKNLVNDLPDYPNTTNSDFTVTRLLGDIPDFEKCNNLVNEWNSELNKFIEDPETGKMKSWKEVNVIFVNIGDLPIEYGYALEAKWEGANKNDYVVCFSMVNNKINWVYPFSWTEIEILKIRTRDLFLDNKDNPNMYQLIDDTCQMIANDFDRKEMADYEYIKYEHGFESYVLSFIICLGLFIGIIYLGKNLD